MTMCADGISLVYISQPVLILGHANYLFRYRTTKAGIQTL